MFNKKISLPNILNQQIIKKIIFFLVVISAIVEVSFAQNRGITRGAEPGELYLTGAWYGIYNPIMPWYYDTLQTAVYRITENGKKLTIQYDADYFANPELVMQPQHILADATTGVLYNKSNYSKNSYPHTSLWVSFDYGKNWIFREENIGSNGYYAANIEGLIYRAYYIFYESLDYGFTFSEVDYGPGGSEPGLQNGEGFSVWYTSNKLLRYSNDFGNTFIEFPIDEQFVFGQIWGRFPDVYRGGLSGEVYVSSMFPYNNQYNPDVKYKVSFSADTGHTFRHVYVSEFLDPDKSFPIFMSDREPGVFYIVKSYQVEDFNPWGHHTKVCIEYYRDYGEILEATFCHDITKNYEYEEIICAHTTLLESTVHQNSIQLQWVNPVEKIRGYHVFRNNTRITSQMLTEPIYLDENLPNGNYDYYVRTYYEEGCASDSSNHVKVQIGIGVKEIITPHFTIVPNPATNQVTISSVTPFHSVEIINFLGQTVVSQTIEGNTATLYVSDLNNGIYFVRVGFAGGCSVRKLVKM